MVALNRMTLALAIAAMGFACGDDDDGNTEKNLDASVTDSAVKGDGGNADASTFACTSYQLPANGMCGGSHCLETLAEITSEKSSTAICSKPEELSEFCSLSSVKTVQGCVVPAALGGATGDALTTAVRDCATPKLPNYTAPCLDCFVKSATCAAAKCFNECLNPDTPLCDQCRVTQGCINDFYTCSGLHNPLL